MYCVYYLMALSTGLRRGELCALRWNDLHGGRVLRIQRSRSTVVGQGVVESDTKNHRDRTVVLSELVYDALGQWRYEQLTSGYTTSLDSLIFATTKGPVHPDTFSRHLRRLYDKNGFSREYHLHTLRHYFASYLLENNISKQVTADMLGHADTAFLERTYCHPQYDYKAQAAHRLNDLIVPVDRELSPETDVTA